ncbi:MAG: hypothetical protein R3202_10700, partial [Candidatus Competibacterales bacterium]|nr:hypothetical protein [Candidatus Competibacterales bacterium]
RILGAMEEGEVDSLALPLIGSGRFGLDPALLAYDLFRELADLALRLPSRRRPRVEVTVREPAMFRHLQQAGVQALLDRFHGPSPIPDLQLDIDYLDAFSETQVRTSLARYTAWQLVRYAELAAGFMLFDLARALGLGPLQLLGRGESPGFGWVRTTAHQLALKLERSRVDPWTGFWVERLLDDLRLRHGLWRINQDRNHLAHGRDARGPEAIAADLRGLIDAPGWQALLRRHGPCDPDRLVPWLRRDPVSGEHGVLERWQPGQGSYVVPASGRTFRHPIGAVPGPAVRS